MAPFHTTWFPFCFLFLIPLISCQGDAKLDAAGGVANKDPGQTEVMTPIEELPKIIRQHLIDKLNITHKAQQGRGFFDVLGHAVGAGLKMAYNVADVVTFGVSTNLIEKAKETAIDVALNAYTSGMLDKRELAEADAPVIQDALVNK